MLCLILLCVKGVPLIVVPIQLTNLKSLKDSMRIIDKGSEITQEQKHNQAALSQQNYHHIHSHNNVKCKNRCMTLET